MFTIIDNKALKLSNGLLVNTEQLEKLTRNVCHYVEHVAIAENQDEQILAMIFPNRSLFKQPDYQKSPEEGCFCPRTMDELGRCLSGCMHAINMSLLPGMAKIDAAVIINASLSTGDGTLDDSLKLNPTKILEKYGDHLDNLFGQKKQVNEEVFNMKLQ